jgi:hypothetical protein
MGSPNYVLQKVLYGILTDSRIFHSSVVSISIVGGKMGIGARSLPECGFKAKSKLKSNLKKESRFGGI